MNSRPKLTLDWASHQAAKYAVENWHYSRRMPTGKNNIVGVWEDDKFCGVVIFGLGSGNSTRGEQFGLAKRWQVAELVRVAMRAHWHPTSKVVSIATRMIAKHNPGLQMLVSFADMAQGHVGTIYQASNWVYIGSKQTNDAVLIDGRIWHPRSVSAKGGMKWARSIDPNAHALKTPPKHKYIFPISKHAKQWAEQHRKPYPKQRVGSDTSDTSVIHTEKAGAKPSPTL